MNSLAHKFVISQPELSAQKSARENFFALPDDAIVAAEISLQSGLDINSLVSYVHNAGFEMSSPKASPARPVPYTSTKERLVELAESDEITSVKIMRIVDAAPTP